MYPQFQIIEEFSHIATDIVLVLGHWNEFANLWYSALSAALWQVLQKQEKRSFFDKLVELYNAPVIEEFS